MAFYQKLFGWKYPDKMDLPDGEAYTSSTSATP